ncbi:MAG: molybdopterin-dependent oxidoreductase [Natronincolaceae bacterium]
MKILSKTGTKMFFALMLIAGLIFQFCYILLPQDVYAQETTLIITGDGVKNQKNYTLEKLKSMPQTRAIFSTVNTYPTKNWHVGEGVTLKDLLKEAGIKDDAKKIKFYASDGFYQEFTIKEIF